jgi:hypothetical protein
MVSRPLSPHLAGQVTVIDYRALYLREARCALFHARHHRLGGDRSAAAWSFANAVRFVRLVSGA